MPRKNLVDLQGTIVGKLKVTRKGNGRYTKGGYYKTTWICECKCGNVVEVDAEKLKRGTTTSCGCIRKQKIASVNFENIVGNKYGKLTVIRYIPLEERENKTRGWLCRCDCGNLTQVNVSKLKSGHTQSCGCNVSEHIANVNRKYEYTGKRLYSVYKAMLDRCYNPNIQPYRNYGGRGIKVCSEWQGDYGFDTFAEWALLSGYSEIANQGECTLERVDVNGNYEPSNCKWITNLEQQNNRRNCIFSEHNGEKHTIAEWARILNITYSQAHWRIKVKGMSIQEIIDEFE